MIYLVIFLAIVLFLLFCYYENNKIDTTYYNIKSKDAGKSFKIAYLSDFHSKPFKSILEKLINEKPDIICITGDYIWNKDGKNILKHLLLIYHRIYSKY